MADMNYLYTLGGYATLIGVGYVIYQVSTQKNRKRAGAPPAKSLKSSQPEPRKEDRKKKQRMETFASEAQETKKAAKAKASSPTPETNSWLSNAQDNSRDDDVDNLKFARQLAKAQEGAKFSTKSDGGKQREKSVKQSRANQLVEAAEEKESAPSSTTGIDADDDQSSISSPEVGPAVAGDVSDMLEAAPARPSVLRITDTAPKKQQKEKAAKAPEPVETKKQRQNRKKAEAAKAAREEAEKERKVLEEKQRRTARIAEGRAAKDGSQFTAANGNKSAWTQGAPSSNGAAPAAQTNGFHQPLDTFESSTTTHPAKPADNNWISSLPSEEEQMEMLKSDEDEWSTVKTKSSKKAVKNESSVDSGDEPSRPSIQPKQVSTSNKAAKPSQSFGSFSALSSKDEPADEEEVEEEWL